MYSLDLFFCLFSAIIITIGFYRGFVKEIICTAGTVISFILLFKYGYLAKPYIQENLNINIPTMFAYLIFYLIVFIAAWIVEFIICTILKPVRGNLFDRLMGATFGFIKSLFLFFIFYLCITTMMFVLYPEKQHEPDTLKQDSLVGRFVMLAYQGIENNEHLPKIVQQSISNDSHVSVEVKKSTLSMYKRKHIKKMISSHKGKESGQTKNDDNNTQSILFSKYSHSKNDQNTNIPSKETTKLNQATKNRNLKSYRNNYKNTPKKSIVNSDNNNKEKLEKNKEIENSSINYIKNMKFILSDKFTELKAFIASHAQ